MIAQPAFSFVPGMAIPGSARPGLVQITPGATQWPYKGPVTLYYLDYLDAATGHTLIAVPGVSYTMIVANPRAGLTDPPPDGRWGGTGTAITFRIIAPSAAELQAARERALAAHGHYPGAACRQCDPVPLQVPPPIPAGALHGHYPGSECRQCRPVPREPAPPMIHRVPGPDVAPQPARPPLTAEQAKAAHGHYNGSACRHCDPARGVPEPPVVRRVPGPDFAPQPSMAQVRADLERARVAHGHYAPGGCKECMSGGREPEAVVV